MKRGVLEYNRTWPRHYVVTFFNSACFAWYRSLRKYNKIFFLCVLSSSFLLPFYFSSSNYSATKVSEPLRSLKMTGDGVSTRLQKEVGSLQQEISKFHEEIARVEAKLEHRLQDLKSELQGDLQALLGQYFGPPPIGSSANASGDKGKGVLGAPPGFVPKNTELPQMPTNGGSVQMKDSSFATGGSVNHSRLECPKFDGTDFRGWWTKLEQYFKAEEVPDVSKVRLVMLNLEGRALEWHHFYSQQNGGL